MLFNMTDSRGVTIVEKALFASAQFNIFLPDIFLFSRFFIALLISQRWDWQLTGCLNATAIKEYGDMFLR